MFESNSWEFAEGWLRNAEEGDWVENENRKIECVNMCGGKYMKFDEEGYVGLTDSVDDAIRFLKGE